MKKALSIVSIILKCIVSFYNKIFTSSKWNYASIKDEMTDSVIKYAFIDSKEGIECSIFTYKKGVISILLEKDSDYLYNECIDNIYENIIEVRCDGGIPFFIHNKSTQFSKFYSLKIDSNLQVEDEFTKIHNATNIVLKVHLQYSGIRYYHFNIKEPLNDDMLSD